jgi:transporter family-2 protein
LFSGETLLFLLIAGLAGALMAVQGTLNALAGKIVGLIPATFIVNLLGSVAAGLLLFSFNHNTTALGEILQKIPSVPFYAWLGGPIGVAIIYGVAVSIPRLGVGSATTGIITFQLLTAYAIDHFGLFGREHLPFNWIKLTGILLLAAGSYLLLKK